MNEACIVCGCKRKKILFRKKSGTGKYFEIYKCVQCELEFISPLPDLDELAGYYQSDYFLKRTERGYNNYFSKEIKDEVRRVFSLNLKDLNFRKFEKSLSSPKRSLDIGCAAGYFVQLLSERGWESHGIDVSKICTDYAQNELNQKVICGDYIDTEYLEEFSLITLWATIEHLNNPEEVLRKVNDDLVKGGTLYLSTCRTGSVFKKIRGVNWRYYNVPEHVYYFNIRNIKRLLKKSGFKVERVFTYGSGFGKGGALLKKIADFTARYLQFGDMMVIAATKEK